MKSFSIYGRELSGGRALEVARIGGEWGHWVVEIGPVNDPTATWIVDLAFTRRGAIRAAKRWLTSRYPETTRLYESRRP